MLYYFIGTKKNMERALNEAGFTSYNEMRKEYGTIDEMVKVHGKRYVRTVVLTEV